MSGLLSNSLFLSTAAAAGGYQVSRSLRFNSSDSAYCGRVFSTNGTDRKRLTLSYWIKLCDTSAARTVISGYNGSSAEAAYWQFNSGGAFSMGLGGASSFGITTTQVFRDPSAWYHFVISIDTTVASPSSDRIKLYVNGTQVTTFSSSTYPTQNYEVNLLNAGTQTNIGVAWNTGYGGYMNGYLADIHFIDGQALTPSSFTEVSATTGQLIPKAYTGTFGTNGFWLKFSDNSAATAATLGNDYSGNNNDWTPNNFSVVGGPANVITTPASNAPPTVDYLVVAGGGGGGSGGTADGLGGGGGAGGFRTANGFSVTSSTQYTVTVGAGGSANPSANGSNGTDSVFSSITSTGGGGGGGFDLRTGNSGGSGGGGAHGSGVGGAGTGGQGFAGGNGAASKSGGGGGAGAVGVAAVASTSNGAGGPGSASSLSGASVTYAGGGGGSGASGGTGGTGGGGAGGAPNGTDGTTNLGGGGGGGPTNGGAGGSGIVIIRYANTYADLTVASSLTYTYANTGGYKIYSFTASVTPAQSAGNDSLVDTPTSYGTDTGAGGEVRGNYATLNPIGLGGGTLSNGNLDLSTSTALAAVGTVAMKTGKWYWEITCNTVANPRIGVFNIGASSPTGLGGDANGWCLLNSPSRTFNSGSAPSYGTFSPVSGTIVNVAYDADAGKLWFGQDGSYFASGNPATGANASMSSVTGSAIVPAISSGGTDAYSANFGQRPFAYTAPSGFKALCDTNLGAPLVAKPNQNFDIITYPGNGSTQTLPNATSTPATALDFGGVGQIGFSWIKQRSDPSTSHALYDARRGVQARLESDTTDQEATSDNGVTAFNAGTFALGSQAQANSSSETYVAWCWATAAQDSSSHTQGSITSQVRANVSAGFSIVTYTGNGTGGATFGHGLGVKPGFSICKKRTGSLDGWYILHSSLGATKYVALNSTSGATPYSGLWNNTEPTSTLFSLGVDYGSNQSGVNYVSYQFAPVVGYSSFGSYTGNASSDGPFVYTGFRPRWILLKSTGANGASWTLFDTARNTYNETNSYLFANSPGVEGAAFPIDILSNGFKLRTSDGLLNSSSYTYIFAAFAENPFQYARAR